MAASSIPNLNTLLSSRGGARGRGRGKGREGFRGQNDNDPVTKDRTVQRTDDDAADARMSAVAMRYLDDPFAEYFAQDRLARRYPIINRGTYVRTTAVDTLVNKFLSQHTDQPKQIISLGAGSDTRYFRLVTQNPSLNVVYHELDFATNASSKISTIKRTPALLRAIHAATSETDEVRFSVDGTSLQSPLYNIHALDLRDLDSSSRPVRLPNVSSTIPTLLLSECCLCYLPPSATSSVIQYFQSHFTSAPLALIIYEPINPYDAFGKTMISNLASRGITLQTLETYDTLAKQRARLKDEGFTNSQRAATVGWIWDHWITGQEKVRVGRCEMLDEMEEWHLLAGHYCVAWGWRDWPKEGEEEERTDGPFKEAWENLTGQEIS